jgi:hypothetical protein
MRHQVCADDAEVDRLLLNRTLSRSRAGTRTKALKKIHSDFPILKVGFIAPKSSEFALVLASS